MRTKEARTITVKVCIEDLPVLERSNTPEMTVFLGGPESDQQIVTRDTKFLHLWETGEARMFRIRSSASAEPVSSVGFWKKNWRGSDVYETGWSVHTAYQGNGIAARALTLCLEFAAENGDRDQVFAFPRTDNTGSNALCNHARFALAGEADFEYPKGHPIRVNEWMFDLAACTNLGAAESQRSGHKTSCCCVLYTSPQKRSSSWDNTTSLLLAPDTQELWRQIDWPLAPARQLFR